MREKKERERDNYRDFSVTFIKSNVLKPCYIL